ncbi:hypothetical protein TNCV_114211 [Trichonephila clavipes]|nr:hypothetical protein TNCV_114211 [Trichonephila clavipes]
MTNRKTGLPMPLFLLSLPRNEANRDIYNITEVCFMKVVVEPLKPRNGLRSASAVKGSFTVPDIVLAIPNASSAGNRI